MRSAFFDRGSKNVGVQAIVIPELKFSNIERQIFASDLVIGPDLPRLMSDQKPSIVFVWTAPTTYCPLEWSTTPWGYLPLRR